MGIPYQQMVIGALTCSLVLMVALNLRSRVFLAQSFTVLLIAEVFSWVVWRVFIYHRFFSPLRNLPQPGGGHWLWGHGRTILNNPSGIPAMQWMATIPNNGLIRYLWFFNIERIIVCSPKALAEVLVTNNYAFIKPTPIRVSISRIFGWGLLVTEGDDHRMQRRKLLPAFAFRHIKDLYPLFWTKSREVVQAMTARCGPEGSADMEIFGWASRCTLDIIGVAGLGRDFNAVKDVNSELVQTYRQLAKPSKQQQILQLLSTFIPMAMLTHLPINHNKEVNAAARAIRSVCRDLIREKKAKLANKEQLGVDILSVAIKSGQFSDNNLVDQLMTFLAAGQGTTATLMTWAVYSLCRYPEIQTRLREEVRARLPSVDAVEGVSSVDIDTMPYLNAFCSEVIRCYAPLPQAMREAVHDTTILGQPVPKGTRIILPVWGANMDKSLWGEDASEFKPERWLAKEDGGEADKKKAASGGASSNFALMTFLHGPRSCIGHTFAKAEFACLVAAWVGRLQFELLDKRQMDEKNIEIRGSTVRPAKGLHVRVRVVDGY